MCGEYGEQLQRPHYHACLFCFDFEDRRFYKNQNGYSLYTSDVLEKIWGKGFCTIGDLTFETAAYTARYIMKKITGDDAFHHYVNDDGVMRQPEFVRMSLKPGLGQGWYHKWRDDIYPDDFIIVRGKKMKPPRYYDKMYDVEDPIDLEVMKQSRFQNSLRHAADNTPERLATREKVKIAQTKNLKRHYEDTNNDT